MEINLHANTDICKQKPRISFHAKDIDGYQIGPMQRPDRDHQSERSISASPGVRLPAPGEDSTPFVLRCYVKRAPFRPLYELEPDRRPLYDEFKLYVWRTATLRDIASLLYVRDRSLSSPSTLHAFRVVHYDAVRRQCVAREVGFGVTRLAAQALDKALDDVLILPSATENGETSSALYDSLVKECRQSMQARESDEGDASKTLDEIGYRDGCILDCVIKEPSIAGERVREHHYDR